MNLLQPETHKQDAQFLLEQWIQLTSQAGMVAGEFCNIHRVAFDRRPVAFFLGSEALGLSEELTKQLESRVSVPMVRGVDSFSVNAAAAVLLYEFARQTQGGAQPVAPRRADPPQR